MQPITSNQLQNALREHKNWLASIGSKGTKLCIYDSDFTGLNLCNQDLSESFLSGNNFDGVSLENSDLYSAFLGGSTFRYANLCAINMTKADLNNVCFAYADMRSAKFFRARFWETDCQCANMSWADMRHANLDDVNFMNTNLCHVDFSGASLMSVQFYNADLTGIKGLNVAHIYSIDIGMEGQPQMLEGKDALQWLMKHS